MSPRRRTPKNTGFPPNVKVDRKYSDGKQVGVYYYYIFPDGTREPLPADEKAAIEAATALNQYFASQESVSFVHSILQRRSAKAGTINDLIDDFEKEWLPSKRYSERTLEEIGYKLAEYRRTWGEIGVTEPTTRTLAVWLNQKPVSSYIKHRGLLQDLFKFAVSQGYREDSPASLLMEKESDPIERKPHTQEGYDTIYKISPDWMQRAMEIAVTSLQRRADLTRLHKEQIDLDRGTITVRQRKTEKYKTPVFIEIEMGERLRNAVSACFQSGMLCPYLLHRKPERISKAKLHPFAVTDGFLSKQFAKYRDISGVYDHLPKNERPAWHSLRGLGIFLYQEAGHSNEYIMALSGHASEEMVEYYADGHKAKKPVLVKAGLK
jgi:integrase